MEILSGFPKSNEAKNIDVRLAGCFKTYLGRCGSPPGGMVVGQDGSW